MASKRVAVLGSGLVGKALSDGFLDHGHAVMRGSRDPGKFADWLQTAGPQARAGTFAEAAEYGEIVVLAVKGVAAESVVGLAGPDRLAGKTVIDTTNPIAQGPPVNGVLSYFTGVDDSLMERLQRLAPRAHFVKAFSIVGNAFMVHPDFGGTTPTMFICGNDPGAKAEVTEILTRFGWETEDVGGVEGARAIEPLCILWCAPGFLRGQWNHAFKLLKK